MGYSPNEAAAAAEVWSETAGLKEKRDYWWLDLVAIPKSTSYQSWKPTLPAYRRGWTCPLPKTARFVAISFTRTDGVPAIGIVLREPDEDIWVTWFDATRATEAHSTTEKLNEEIERIWRHWERSGTEGVSPSSPAQWLTFEQGHEHAPDSRWGRQTLRLAADGRYLYERRRLSEHQEARGAIAAGRASEVFAELKRSTFPLVENHDVPPGATTLTFRISDRSEPADDDSSVSMDRRFALSLPHYREAIGVLQELTDALRENDTAALASWEREQK
jgi:hypothetical protein